MFTLNGTPLVFLFALGEGSFNGKLIYCCSEDERSGFETLKEEYE